MDEGKSPSLARYVALQAVLLLALLVVFYFWFPPDKRWRVIGIACAIAVVAFAGGYFLPAKKRP